MINAFTEIEGEVVEEDGAVIVLNNSSTPHMFDGWLLATHRCWNKKISTSYDRNILFVSASAAVSTLCFRTAGGLFACEANDVSTLRVSPNKRLC